VRLHRRPSAAAAAYAAAPVAAGSTPWREAAYCVVDLELSGLDPKRHEILSWAAVCIDGGRVTCRTAAEGLVHPRRDVPPESVCIHGLRAPDLATAPSLAEATDALLAAMTGRVLIAHASWVEESFLGPALRARGVRLRRPVLDTCALGRLWLCGTDGSAPPAVSLGMLAARLGLPEHRPHRASGDALTTAQVFVALATLLEEAGPETVGTLALAPERLAVGALCDGPTHA
jgi:DNA polymerase-3 subunit epsilon